MTHQQAVEELRNLLHTMTATEVMYALVDASQRNTAHSSWPDRRSHANAVIVDEQLETCYENLMKLKEITGRG